MAVIPEVDAGEHTTFDPTGQSRYKRPLPKESTMERRNVKSFHLCAYSWSENLRRPQASMVATKTVATIQSGDSLRLEPGKDPQDLNWVEITVRKAKRRRRPPLSKPLICALY